MKVGDEDMEWRLIFDRVRDYKMEDERRRIQG